MTLLGLIQLFYSLILPAFKYVKYVRLLCRVSYYDSYIAAMRRAIRDGANIAGYFAWSLMDNFEYAIDCFPCIRHVLRL